MTSHNRHPPKLSSERRRFQDTWFPHSRIVFFSSRARTGMIVWKCALGEIQHFARGNGHTKPALNLHTRASEYHTGKNVLRVTTERSHESPRPRTRQGRCSDRQGAGVCPPPWLAPSLVSKVLLFPLPSPLPSPYPFFSTASPLFQGRKQGQTREKAR